MSAAKRLQPLDAARGIAMVFVCISHFALVYFRELPGHELEMIVLRRISMMASPMFMVLSGLLLGFLFRARPDERPALRAKLIDRALFTLTIGHVLLECARSWADDVHHHLQWAFITDVVAVGLLVGPVLIERLAPRQRLLLAVALYTVGWVAVIGWEPAGPALRMMKDSLVGLLGARLLPGAFPLVPWLAVYIAATVVGERLGALCAAGRTGDMKTMLWRLGVVGVSGALVVKTVPSVLVAAGLLPRMNVVWLLGWPFQKVPPSVAYLGLYGGLGLLMLRGLIAVDERRALRRWLRVPAALGRASLVAFLVQAYVYFTLLAWWHPAYSPAWPLLLAATVVVVVGLGLLWERFGSNDYLSIGYRSMLAILRERAGPFTVRYQLAAVRRPFRFPRR